MPRTPVRRVGQESVSLQALVPWCSSCNGLMGGMVMRHGEGNYYRYYKRLGTFAKLATSYLDQSREPGIRLFEGLARGLEIVDLAKRFIDLTMPQRPLQALDLVPYLLTQHRLTLHETFTKLISYRQLHREMKPVHLRLSRFMLYCASHERRHHEWPVYGLLICSPARRSSWISPA